MIQRAKSVARNLQWLLRSDKSQCGEQAILLSELPPRGLFLEIGAFMPVMWSNTWALERAGWRGQSIDANKEYAFLWRIFRPRSAFRVVAITPEPVQQVDFHAFPGWRGATSSLSADWARSRATDEYGSFRTERVPAVSMDRLLREFHEQWGAAPTLMQTDVEGLDASLLEAMMASPSHLWPAYILTEQFEDEPTPESVQREYQRIGTAGPSVLLRRRS